MVGAGVYEGAPDAALGAFTLFFTNFLAIQVMGGVVYLLMGLGVSRLSQTGESGCWTAPDRQHDNPPGRYD